MEILATYIQIFLETRSIKFTDVLPDFRRSNVENRSPGDLINSEFSWGLALWFAGQCFAEQVFGPQKEESGDISFRSAASCLCDFNKLLNLPEPCFLWCLRVQLGGQFLPDLLRVCDLLRSCLHKWLESLHSIKDRSTSPILRLPGFAASPLSR